MGFHTIPDGGTSNNQIGVYHNYFFTQRTQRKHQDHKEHTSVIQDFAILAITWRALRETLN